MSEEQAVAGSPATLAVIFPTRDNASEIRAHLEQAASWIHLASQIIVVDSSEDETPEICREMLPDHTTILRRPPGLYAAWNAAIEEVDAEFTYISTIGDGIEADFLGKMIALAVKHNRDLIVSPPDFINASLGYEWPIHHYIREYGISDFTLLEPGDMHLVNFCALASFGLSSLSGSFASNLTRTSLLKQHPFPCDYGGFGDLVWFSNACSDIRFGILPDKGSTFTVHQSSHQRFAPEFLHDTLTSMTRRHLEGIQASGVKCLMVCTEVHTTLKMSLKTLRKNRKRIKGHLFYVSILSITKRLYAALSRLETSRARRKLKEILAKA